MKHTSESQGTSEQVVKDIRRATRKQHSTEEKISIVLNGLRLEERDMKELVSTYLEKVEGLLIA